MFEKLSINDAYHSLNYLISNNAAINAEWTTYEFYSR